MKNSVLALLATCLLLDAAACGGGQGGLPSDSGLAPRDSRPPGDSRSSRDGRPPSDQGPTATPVYFTIVSHNERTLTRFGFVRESLDGYRTYRDRLLRFASLIHSYGFKLSWQTDYVVLDGMERYEAQALADDPQRTNGKSVLVFLEQDLGFSIEPHAHECLRPPSGSHCSDQPYNYADIVSRIRSVGLVEPGAIVGGTSSAERKLEELTSCIQGNVFPEIWCPTALTVFSGASGGHEEGGDDFHSGVWRPSSLEGERFLEDDPQGRLAYVGSGYLFMSGSMGPPAAYEPVSFVKQLLARIASGELAASEIYTASLMVAEDASPEAKVFAQIEAALKELRPLAQAGSLLAATYPEVLGAWAGRYGSRANVVGF